MKSKHESMYHTTYTNEMLIFLAYKNSEMNVKATKLQNMKLNNTDNVLTSKTAQKYIIHQKEKQSRLSSIIFNSSLMTKINKN